MTWKFWQKRRYLVVFMAFLGFCNVYTLRVNLSVGIVAMTENRTVHYENGTVGHVSDEYTTSASSFNIIEPFSNRNNISNGILKSKD